VKIKAMTVIMLLLPYGISWGQEAIYPAGTDVSATYQLSDTDLEIGDTLVITRSVTNNEGYALGNLYLSDNLPFEFTILSYSLRIDADPVSHIYSGPVAGEVVPSCNSFRWAIDEPDPGDTTNHLLMPGQTLSFTAEVTCSTVGDYSLPLHTLCAYSGISGIFSVAESLAVSFTPGSGTDDIIPPDNAALPVVFPNPFNSEVVIDPGAGTWSGPLELTVFDLSGGVIFKEEYSVTGIDRRVRWRPGEGIASGVYFYRLQAAGLHSVGKMTFLK
jgi:uncharacterized repeat protein (TIGR01451 family)